MKKVTFSLRFFLFGCKFFTMDKKSFTITISVSEQVHGALKEMAKENYRTLKAQAELNIIERLHQLAVEKVKADESQEK